MNGFWAIIFFCVTAGLQFTTLAENVFIYAEETPNQFILGQKISDEQIEFFSCKGFPQKESRFCKPLITRAQKPAVFSLPEVMALASDNFTHSNFILGVDIALIVVAPLAEGVAGGLIAVRYGHIFLNNSKTFLKWLRGGYVPRFAGQEKAAAFAVGGAAGYSAGLVTHSFLNVILDELDPDVHADIGVSLTAVSGAATSDQLEEVGATLLAGGTQVTVEELNFEQLKKKLMAQLEGVLSSREFNNSNPIMP